MPGSPITARQKKENFARILFSDPKIEKWKAAEQAGYTGTKESLVKTAWRLSNDAHVIEKLAELARQADADAIVDYDQVTTNLHNLALPTVADYWDKNGNFVGFHKLTPVQKAAIKKLKARETRTFELEDIKIETQVIEIELHDRVKLVELMGKLRHVQAFSNVVEHQGEGDHERWLKALEQKRANRRQET